MSASYRRTQSLHEWFATARYRGISYESEAPVSGSAASVPRGRSPTRSSESRHKSQPPSRPSSRREVHERPNEATFDASPQMASVSSDRRAQGWTTTSLSAPRRPVTISCPQGMAPLWSGRLRLGPGPAGPGWEGRLSPPPDGLAMGASYRDVGTDQEQRRPRPRSVRAASSAGSNGFGSGQMRIAGGGPSRSRFPQTQVGDENQMRLRLTSSDGGSA